MNQISKILKLFKKKVFPTKHQLMVREWWADGGDYALRFDYDLSEDSIVLDLGGYKGQWASDLFSRYRCHIFVFEPVTAFAEGICKRFYKNDKIQVYPYGLGGFSRSELIYISADGSSLFAKSKVSETVELIDVEDWIKENSIESIDLIKINIEGGEYELLDRLIESQLINCIENIQVQFHKISIESRLHMERIQMSLMNTHELTYQYDFVWENWKRK